jgi:uncharacterized protein with HEPN domain
MPEHDPIIRLLHMRDYVRKAIAVIEGKTRDDLEKDEILCLALTHLVTLVGETANKYPTEKQKQYPSIAWPKIISMRNRLIHGYDSVDFDILWDAVKNNFPPLLVELNKILPPEEQ